MFPFQQNPQTNPLMNNFGNMQNFVNRFNAFKQNVSQQGLNPQMVVQNMLNNGQMTQSQFNRLSSLADQIMKS